MKRTVNQLLALLLALGMVVGLMIVPASADSVENKATLPSVTAEPGKLAEVPLTVSTANPASYFEAVILCDKDVIPLISVDADGLYVEWGNAQEGYYIDIYQDASKELTNAFTPGSYTVTLRFQVPADAAPGEYLLKFECVDICNERHRTPEIPRLEDGKITVSAGVTLDKTDLRLTAKDETQQLTATTNLKGQPIVWTSSDEKVAIVSDTGLVTAVGDGVTTVTAAVGDVRAQCSVLVTADASVFPVYFFPTQEGATVKVSDYVTPATLYSYTRTVAEGEHAGTHEGYVALLKPGTYTYTVTKSGYYGSTCGFTVKDDGTVAFRQNWTDAVKTQYGLNFLLDAANATFYPELEAFTKSSNPGAWDGVTLDVSWFDPGKTSHTVSTPAQFAGLAAIVNGIYNDEIETIIDLDASGSKTEYTPEQYAALDSAKIKAGCTSGNSTSGGGGNNLVTTDTYYFSALGYDFDGQTVYLAADLDMGGYQDAQGNWTGARYMPIGGQYLMCYVKTELADGYSHLGSSFNGRLEGNGHLVYNIYCDRYSNGNNYGDCQSVGLIGRLGIHDSDYSTWTSLESEGKNGNYGGNYPAVNPSVRNVAVAGYIYSRRSVGGIVGKIGQTSASNLFDGSVGGLIENCVNFATVHNTDSKGVGGIVGSGWNKGAVRNCVNFGSISTTYNCPTGGVVGSNEIPIINCYNMGQISAKQSRYAMAIGTNNGGGNDIRNCYWLTGTALGGGYYRGSTAATAQVKEVKDNYAGTTLTAAAFMQSTNFISLLNGTDSRAFTQASQSDSIYRFLSTVGYAGAPVPRAFTAETASVTKIEKKSDPAKLTYVEGERFDPTGLEIRAYWSDNTEEKLENYTLSIDRPLALGDTKLTVTVSAGSRTESFCFDITVVPVSLAKISISTQPSRRAYNEGDFFDPSGLIVQIDYTNGKSVKAEWKNGAFVNKEDGSAIPGSITLSISTDQPLTMAHNGKVVTVSHTFTDNVTKTADTSKLTVVSAENKPKQENGVYLVGTAGELDWIAAQVNNAIEPSLKARLTADITASESFEPIGTSSNEFTGTFDGDYHRITLSLERDKMYTALFGCVSDATVRNTIVDGSVTVAGSRQFVAGVVALASGNSLIENCGNEADITTGGDCVGGVAGRIEDTTVVSGCYNRGNVNGTALKQKTVGGVIGKVDDITCRVKNCYNLGDVTGGAAGGYGVGGIVGYVQPGSSEAIAGNVYNAGKVTNRNSAYTGNTGAIFGCGYSAHAENYDWLDGSADCAFGRDTGVETGKLTAEELKAAAQQLGEAFKESKHGYPLLTWQTDAHSWSDWTQTKAPTCTVKGEQSHTCSVCGEVETRELPTIEHNWSGWTQTKAPTCTVKGEESRTCSVGGETETREIAALEHTDEDHDYRCDRCGEILKDAPKLLSGDGQKWTKGSKATLSFTSDAAREDFLRVYVDGKELAPESYTLSDDATTVTLHTEYLQTLAIGGYRLRIESRNGTAEAGFQVAAKSASPTTGDSFALFVFLPLAAVSAAMLLLLLKKKRTI